MQHLQVSFSYTFIFYNQRRQAPVCIFWEKTLLFCVPLTKAINLSLRISLNVFIWWWGETDTSSLRLFFLPMWSSSMSDLFSCECTALRSADSSLSPQGGARGQSTAAHVLTGCQLHDTCSKTLLSSRSGLWGNPSPRYVLYP